MENTWKKCNSRSKGRGERARRPKYLKKKKNGTLFKRESVTKTLRALFLFPHVLGSLSRESVRVKPQGNLIGGAVRIFLKWERILLPNVKELERPFWIRVPRFSQLVSRVSFVSDSGTIETPSATRAPVYMIYIIYTIVSLDRPKTRVSDTSFQNSNRNGDAPWGRAGRERASLRRTTASMGDNA